MCIFVSRNIFHVHLNIIICTSRILRQQKRTFEQKYSKFYNIKALNTINFEHMAELFNHMYHGSEYNVWSVTTDYRHTWLLALPWHWNRGSLQHESDIYRGTTDWIERQIFPAYDNRCQESQYFRKIIEQMCMTTYLYAMLSIFGAKQNS